MSYHSNAILFGVALVFASPLGAQVPKRTSVEIFRDATKHQLMGCQMAATTVFRSVQIGKEIRPFSRISMCIHKGKAQTERLFQEATSHVTERPEVARLLNEYYGVWLTVFEGVMPNSMAPGVDYQLRQGEGQRSMEEAWRRFEIALVSQ